MADMSRRSFIASMGAVAGAAALAGCGSTGGNTASTTEAASSAAATGDLALVTAGKFTVGVSPDFPPFENMEDGEYVGMDIELAAKIAEQLGLEVEYKTLQFDSIVPAVAAGGQIDAGISGITVDPKRAKEVDFSHSYYVDDQCIVTMKSNTEVTADDQSALDADGKIIACQSGTTGESYAQENFPSATVQPYGNATDCFAAMQAGQADAVITNKAVGNKMVADAYQDAQVIKEIATGEEYAVAISQDNNALLSAVDGAIDALEADGTLDELATTYLG